MVFKTMYIDRGIPLREGAFFFTIRTLSPPLDKRNTRDKAKGLRITSERHIGELSMRCLSPLNIEDRILRQQSHSEGVQGGEKREAPRPPFAREAVGLMRGGILPQWLSRGVR